LLLDITPMADTGICLRWTVVVIRGRGQGSHSPYRLSTLNLIRTFFVGSGLPTLKTEISGKVIAEHNESITV